MSTPLIGLVVDQVAIDGSAGGYNVTYMISASDGLVTEEAQPLVQVLASNVTSGGVIDRAAINTAVLAHAVAWVQAQHGWTCSAGDIVAAGLINT